MDHKAFKILSGAIHYFRLPQESWYHSLYNLKALGFNTVETYVPWNLHEKKEGQYDFTGNLDIERFLTLAKELGLYAIVRPSPFICAEWEFGGLPAWLLTKNLKLRSSDPQFLHYVSRYYDQLIPILKKHQLDHQGNILMFQIENEYGSYGEDKAYLLAIKNLMRDRGLTQPFFTSDGPWKAAMEAGSLLAEDVLVTGNFGSDPKKNFTAMRTFFQENGKNWPLMCMEFWDGWFNRWGEALVRRDPEETAQTIMEVIEMGSINLYMFHGGSNFAFMNGCSARGQKDLPQVTSYDYGALLDEAGNPTLKYSLLQDKMKKVYPDLDYKEPLVKKSMATSHIKLTQKVSLFASLDQLTNPKASFYPQNMEALNQQVGYLLYRTEVKKSKDEAERFRIIDARDRAQVFVNEKKVSTQYQEEIGEDIFIDLEEGTNQLDILIENMGRVNYGPKLEAPSQSKGLGRGLMLDLHFVGDWQMYPLPLEQVDSIDYSKGWKEGQPSFYHYSFDCMHPEDSYIDMTGFGKGVVFINNFNLGRYWEKGPIFTLYIPKAFLKTGRNCITVFETEGKYQEDIQLVKNPIIRE
nr:beta-galactosidase family protein [Streptococcus catagoni]